MDIEAKEVSEQIDGIVQCNNCGYWGKMTGYIEAGKPKLINFVCSNTLADGTTCGVIERVENPFA